MVCKFKKGDFVSFIRGRFYRIRQYCRVEGYDREKRLYILSGLFEDQHFEISVNHLNRLDLAELKGLVERRIRGVIQGRAAYLRHCLGYPQFKQGVCVAVAVRKLAALHHVLSAVARGEELC